MYRESSITDLNGTNYIVACQINNHTDDGFMSFNNRAVKPLPQIFNRGIIAQQTGSGLVWFLSSSALGVDLKTSQS
ncbi:hypothetical protein FCULG_00007646 [Fusarium culmorum]|uniref:Uncharacterized protein n=1 Tax=Fusarium culmorum TaxID=5516 RepID=A0A2T4H2R3_FUSCU|nr:hypothetical protein FCULG_00007646 [Fusarium culmorum]